MDLELEIINEVTDVAEGEEPQRQKPTVVKLRESHHAVARLVALGQSPAEISLQTGYSLARLYTLAVNPSFRDLVAFYRNDEAAVHQDFMFRMGLVAQDALQEIHERLQDNPERFDEDQLTDLFKVVADRAGYAPVQRTINKSLHMTIGARFDQAEQRALTRKKDVV